MWDYREFFNSWLSFQERQAKALENMGTSLANIDISLEIIKQKLLEEES